MLPLSKLIYSASCIDIVPLWLTYDWYPNYDFVYGKSYQMTHSTWVFVETTINRQLRVFIDNWTQPLMLTNYSNGEPFTYGTYRVMTPTVWSHVKSEICDLFYRTITSPLPVITANHCKTICHDR